MLTTVSRCGRAYSNTSCFSVLQGSVAKWANQSYQQVIYPKYVCASRRTSPKQNNTESPGIRQHFAAIPCVVRAFLTLALHLVGCTHLQSKYPVTFNPSYPLVWRASPCMLTFAPLRNPRSARFATHRASTLRNLLSYLCCVTRMGTGRGMWRQTTAPTYWGGYQGGRIDMVGRVAKLLPCRCLNNLCKKMD